MKVIAAGIVCTCIFCFGKAIRDKTAKVYQQFCEETEPEEWIDFNYWQNRNADVYAWIRSMFGCLDKYLDRDYFEKYNEVFLFTPEEKRTYHIIAAYEHPAEHILTSYDFSTTEGINDYLRQIPDFVADSGGVIQDETEITPPLLTLSTCTRNDKQKRCLVQGILVECEKKNQEE